MASSYPGFFFERMEDYRDEALFSRRCARPMAHKMVCEWGMSELGPLSFGKKDEQIFFGREIAQRQDYSEETAIKIDRQVRKLIGDGYNTAKP